MSKQLVDTHSKFLFLNGQEHSKGTGI